MFKMTTEPTQYAPRRRMPVGAFAHTAVPRAGADLRVNGTTVPMGIATTAVRVDAFDTPGVRCWSPPV